MTSLQYDSFIADKNNYNVVKDLGSGRFGSMKQAAHRDEPDRPIYAIRELNAADETLNRNFFREIELFIRIRSHPAICKFYRYSITPQSIITEFLDNGSLLKVFSELKSRKKVDWWTPTVRSKTVFGITASLLHLHNHGFFHRYLSPKSIMFDKNCEPRLVDFAFARVEVSTAATMVNSSDPMYTAPEMYQSDKYDKRVDNFALGMIFYLIATGKEPYTSSTAINISRQIVDGKRPDIPATVNKKLAHIMEDLWSQNPEERPEFIDIFKAFADYDEPLFEGTDMEEYARYRDRIMKSTFLTEDDEEFMKAPKIKDEDIPLFEEAYTNAQKGGADAKCLVKVAKMFESGIGTDQDLEQALEYYEKAAKKESADALYKVANFYAVGSIVEPDNAKYIEYLKKSADKKYPPAIIDYAVLLQTGTLVEKDLEKAKELFTQMANPPHNMEEAMYHLAQMLEESDPKAAADYYRQAKESGLLPAYIAYALMLLEGKGIPMNQPEGIRILKNAVDLGNALANFNLGFIHETGKYDQKKDGKLSLEYFKKASELGLAMAHVKYGKALYRGKHADCDVEIDPEHAARLFESAARQGDPEGLHSWATFCQNGYGGTPVNMAEAQSLYEMAAEKGFAPSMVRLAAIYLNGLFGARDTRKAKEYAQKAADMGYKDGIDFLNNNKF